MAHTPTLAIYTASTPGFHTLSYSTECSAQSPTPSKERTLPYTISSTDVLLNILLYEYNQIHTQNKILNITGHINRIQNEY